MTSALQFFADPGQSRALGPEFDDQIDRFLFAAVRHLPASLANSLSEGNEAALAAALSMLADCESNLRDKRTALRLLERVNTRVDDRAKWMIQNITERLRIKASVAADTARTWQPNHRRPPRDPELQALIDGAGADSDAWLPGDEVRSRKKTIERGPFSRRSNLLSCIA